MADIFKQLYSINIVNYIGVEDFSDRLNFLYTATLLTICCTITIGRGYVMHPISCYLPNTFGSYHEEKDMKGQLDFVNNYCWSEGTYAVDVREFHLEGTSDSGGLELYADRKINFYQWVPFVLALQGLCFYLPRVIWHAVSFGRAGTDVGHIVKVARDASRADDKKHDRLLNHACRMVEQMLDRQANKARPDDQSQLEGIRRACNRCLAIVMPTRFVGSGLIFTYLLIKLTYIGNAIGQLALMQNFLQLNSTRYSLLGIKLLDDIIWGKDWHNTIVFPRIGCCAVYLRSAARGNWQFSQCSLPVNMIYEKIYVFLWFWFIFVALATIFSTISWIWRLCNAAMSSRFVRKYLKLADNYEELKKSGQVKGFVRNFLRRDGAFLMKMIALNCGDLICAEVIQTLWLRYKKAKGFIALDEAQQENLENAVLKLSCKNLPLSTDNKTRRRFFHRQQSLPVNSLFRHEEGDPKA
ncbi:hypothetical protein BOX15_Mlig030358g3 [Macrostomum lignano]|uniref:Innexin n=1 Tax=Macrostomum lignano TaxID=282301 RepID=A0A267FXU5_9PLAT|nr:hypothetical protein BOX15_Mlig030358g2 [Macrostomum lignano]PAA78024.1 hypothetical protein BOX15_Mlig030358g3 [Macrostomum lignano]